VREIKVAIAGVGNCASSLVQGLHYYGCRYPDAPGIMRRVIGGYTAAHVRPVAAFDIDHRKVGRPLHEAIFAEPNCAAVFQPEVSDFGVTVQMSPVLDGVAAHMQHYSENRSFRAAERPPVDITEELRASGAEVLLCYLPVGAEQAVRAYADACLDARVAMVNCVPVFIASDREYASRFRSAGVPIVGDDIKSQFGATLMHRILMRTLGDRGCKITETYQLNTGGNTDFLNMLDRARLQSKKRSKTESVRSQIDVPMVDDAIHIGPSDYVPWQNDNKVCFLRVQWLGFGGVPMNLEARLSVEDSPNSAGIVLDALRCAKVAMDRGISGPLEGVSAYLMKRPPQQMRDDLAAQAFNDFIADP
jgi:myo-inositol-1-phosphate synthase